MSSKSSLRFTDIVLRALKILFLLIISVFAAFPFVWMVVSSLKTKAEVMDVSHFLPSVPQWGNISEILFSSPIPSYIANSIITSVLIVALQIVTGAMLAYSIVFMRYRGRKAIFAVIMATYMLPVAATYIPSYIILSRIKLLNTLKGLVISSTINMFGIFLLRQSFMSVPKAVYEAAEIDGANNWKTLWRVIYPLTKSSFITFGLMSFISTYNNYMWPSLITNDSSKYLVSQGLRSFLIEGGAYGTEWQLVMAASSVVVIPLLILFAFTQKWFITGIGGETGVKG